MNPFGTTIDLDEINQRNADVSVNFIKLLLPVPGELRTPESIQELMKGLAVSLADTGALIGEVKRLREQRQKTRDIHSPANSTDPASPGAICTGCSMHGSRVAWPCPTWNATEDGR